jgi:hypothetical protein
MDMYRIRFNDDDDIALDITDPEVLAQIAYMETETGNTRPKLAYDMDSERMELVFDEKNSVEFQMSGLNKLFVDSVQLKDNSATIDANLREIQPERGDPGDPNQPDNLCPC